MMARGSKYASPLDPPRDPRFRKALTPLEIETAKADVASKNQTHLVGTWFAVESTYQNREVVKHRKALIEFDLANAREIRRAAGVLGGFGRHGAS
jgi:hypothetical protein